MFTFAALLALALQAFVVQTHVHAAAAPASAAYEWAHATDSHAELTGLSAHGQTCVVCMTLATTSTALPPTAAWSAAQVVTFEAALAALPDAPRALSHAWRSRAPPILL